MGPKDYLYTESHEWVSVQEKIAIVGITDFAIQELTDLVFVELPPAGTEIAKGESFGEVESVKTVAELYAPVSGKIIESNTELAENLDWLSESPYEKGWMVKIEMSHPQELDTLLSWEAYEAYLEKQK